MSTNRENHDIHFKKGFKIHGKDKKIGIVASTFQELLFKCRTKFCLDEESTTIKLIDGTEVDEEYFEILENNEELFLGRSESVSSQILARLEDFLSEYTDSNFNDVDYHLKGILQSGNISVMLHALGSLNSDFSICHKSSRDEDANWFLGLHTKYSTKEAVLRNSAENRMRGYLQKFKKDLECCKESLAFKTLINLLQQKLRSKKYNASYFDRSAAMGEQLCDLQGLFHCDGDFQRDDCANHHLINPYSSREDRILFSTWNFDHVIEKSRSIVPAVKEALEDSPKYLVINCNYLFELLFEHRSSERDFSGNLKLVHVICHNKNPHNLFCDKKKIFIHPFGSRKNIQN